MSGKSRRIITLIPIIDNNSHNSSSILIRLFHKWSICNIRMQMSLLWSTSLNIEGVDRTCLVKSLMMIRDHRMSMSKLKVDLVALNQVTSKRTWLVDSITTTTMSIRTSKTMANRPNQEQPTHLIMTQADTHPATDTDEKDL